ncbi:unnamed protein product [Paramecium octaurelia]|uniref:Uncharacterized protein n=1 Tax=Paramecium octaurelia TaxID=43137 RepID=A0A8S1UY85_PAROT|nr:unnamed protein product [Paramecium octaurelia]
MNIFQVAIFQKEMNKIIIETQIITAFFIISEQEEPIIQTKRYKKSYFVPQFENLNILLSKQNFTSCKIFKNGLIISRLNEFQRKIRFDIKRLQMKMELLSYFVQVNQHQIIQLKFISIKFQIKIKWLQNKLYKQSKNEYIVAFYQCFNQKLLYSNNSDIQTIGDAQMKDLNDQLQQFPF